MTQPPHYPPPIHPPVSGPPPGLYPARKPSFWGSAGGILAIIGIIFAGLLVVCGGLVVIGRVSDSRALENIDAQVTSCTGSSSVATIGYTVTNKGKDARRVTLKVEYRDASGARLDTDTARVGSVPAGDTVRGEESTILNASTSGTITCRIVGVS